MDVHVVVVAYGQEKLTQLCMASIGLTLQARRNPNLNWCVWSVDNGSEIPLQLDPVVGLWPAGIELHTDRIAENAYLFGALNSAVDRAIATSLDPCAVIISDNDIIWTPGALESLVENLQTFDTVSPQYQFDGCKDFQDEILSYPRPLENTVALHQAWAAARAGTAVLSPAFYSSCFAVSSQTWNQVGGFDTRFKLIYNDCDWERRALALGKRLAVLGSVPVFHRTATTRELNPDRSEIYQEDHRYFLSKWPSARIS